MVVAGGISVPLYINYINWTIISKRLQEVCGFLHAWALLLLRLKFWTIWFSNYLEPYRSTSYFISNKCDAFKSLTKQEFYPRLSSGQRQIIAEGFRRKTQQNSLKYCSTTVIYYIIFKCPSSAFVKLLPYIIYFMRISGRWIFQTAGQADAKSNIKQDQCYSCNP